MNFPFLTRLLEIKEEQLEIEHQKLELLGKINSKLLTIRSNTTPTGRRVLK